MVNLIVVLVFAALPSFSVAENPQDKVDLKYIGCYEDRGVNDRAFGHFFYNAKKYIDWNRWRDLSYIVQICAKELLASGKSYEVFAVQDWGECRGDKDSNRYKTFKKSTKCYSHVGSPFNNAVYRINFKCNVNDPEYRNGLTHYIPRGHTECKACKCKAGSRECNAITCDYPFPCEKYTPVPKGSCCSKCACHHLGKDKMNGEEWDDRREPGTCKQCRCLNGEASCEKASCPENCPQPEYIPGQCCPRCRPKAPTTYPWEIITEPTRRPKLTFPPWLKPPLGFGKKSLRKKRSKKAIRVA